jgi:hypothetical protein
MRPVLHYSQPYDNRKLCGLSKKAARHPDREFLSWTLLRARRNQKSPKKTDKT